MLNAGILIRSPELFRWLDRAEKLASLARGREAGGTASRRNLTSFYDAIWADAARELGATIEPLGSGAFEIRRGRASVRVLENNTGIDDLVSHVVVRTKPLLYSLFVREGLPVPRHLVFGPEDTPRAAEFVRGLGGRSSVVKPALGSAGGNGVTTGVRGGWALGRAVAFARRYSNTLLIEEQVPGENFRLLFLDGELIDAVERRAPRVVGDGRTTVEGLISAANRRRNESADGAAHARITIDMDVRNTLAEQGLHLGSVPPEGREIRVKTASNENAGTENATVTASVHPSVAEDCARAARVSGLRLAGVDVITTEISRPLRETGGVVLETNSPPGYFWHYRKKDGPFPVAVRVLEKLLSEKEKYDA